MPPAGSKGKGSAAPPGRAVQAKPPLPSRGSKQQAAPAPSSSSEEEEEDVEDDDDDDNEEEDDDEEGDDSNDDSNEDEDEDSSDDDDDDEFEQQQSSDDESVPIEEDEEEESDKDVGASAKAAVDAAESQPRKSRDSHLKARQQSLKSDGSSGALGVSKFMHTDDLSSDDEEDPEGNVIGRVPLHWYDAYDHIGYNIQGGKVAKRKGKDRIDLAIDNRDDPAAGRTVYDMYNDRTVVLSDRDLEILRRIQAGAFAHAEHDDTPDYVPYVSGEKETMPIWAVPEPKRRFIPSKWEYMKVMKIVKAMREGRYKTLAEIKEEKKKELAGTSGLRLMWNDEEDEVLAESKRNQYHLPAPKMPLPGHAESYNPPAEYLLTEEEQAAQEKLSPEERLHNFQPKAHSCLRHVGGYRDFVRERFERCLDLYLCPRKLKKRLNIDPETLVPRLPRPRELKPFPNSLVLQFLGHKKAVRSISVSPDGQYLATGGEDGTVRLWEVDTCLCRYTWTVGKPSTVDGKKTVEPVCTVAFNPNTSHHVLAVAVGSRLVLITTGTGDADAAEVTEALLASAESAAKAAAASKGDSDDDDGSDEDGDGDEEESGGNKRKRKTVCSWHTISAPSSSSSSSVPAQDLRHGARVGPRAYLQFAHDVTSTTWHSKGDYLATLCPGDNSKSLAVHQVSKAKSQTPFNKNPGLVQAVLFHPTRPFVFVATQQHVKVFNLVEQKMVKRLLSGCKWLSCMAVHPQGDHIVVASYDRRVVWFDLDLSSTPHKTLKFHEKAVRSVQFHPRYPLLASASDDGTVHVFHSTVYSDLTKNPLIVPLKVLRGHGVVGGVGVLSVAFHPRQPWVFSAGADGVVNLFQDI